jgi:hypothetical protein
MRLNLVFAIAISSASCVVGEEKTIEVPLRSIWAAGMPGTRSVYEIDPEIAQAIRDIPSDDTRDAKVTVLAYKMRDKSLVHQFFGSLSSLPRDKQPAKGFAVSGTGQEALKKLAIARLDNGPDVLPVGEVSLVFFARQAPESVHLEKVTRCEGNVEISYRLASRDTFVKSEHFALIPLGKLPAGTYKVDITTERKRPATRSVCRPFSFTVEKP